MSTPIDSLIDNLIRPELKTLKPYESARRLFSMASTDEVETDWLNANENPFLPEINVNPALFNRYPDFQPEPLIRAYAEYAGVNNENVLASRGADEAIELLIRTFCQSDPSDQIVICPPTYGMYAISAETHGCSIKKIPLNTDLQLDLPALLPEIDKSQIIFVCSPNNPTGDVVNREDLISLLEASFDKCLVVADEAYIEFCPEASVVELIERYPNLVVTRTLSKAFGLAGLRCGFTVANPAVIDAMKKVIAPYPVPAPVAQIASQSLSQQGLKWMRETVSLLNSLRDKFIEQAKSWSFVDVVYPSKTNFVLIKLKPNVTAEQVMQKFLSANVLLRNQSKQLMLDNTIRVSIGDEQQMNKVINLFTQLEQAL